MDLVPSITKDTSSAATWLQFTSPCHRDTSIPLRSTLLIGEPSGIRYTFPDRFHALGLDWDVEPEEAFPEPGLPGPGSLALWEEVFPPGPSAHTGLAAAPVITAIIPAIAMHWQRLAKYFLFFMHISPLYCDHTLFFVRLVKFTIIIPAFFYFLLNLF